jgi:hypothetical protein
MRLSITELKDYLACPQLAHNLHILRRGPLRSRPR